MSRRGLTAREVRIADLVPDGLSNPEIADTLRIARSTVKSALNNIMIKWDCANRVQVAVKATRHGAED